MSLDDWKQPQKKKKRFFFFHVCTWGIRKFPGQGVNWSCSCRSAPQPQQHQIWATSGNRAAACSNARSLTHRVKPGVKLTSSQRQHCVLNALRHNGNSKRFLSIQLWECKFHFFFLYCHSFYNLSTFGLWFYSPLVFKNHSFLSFGLFLTGLSLPSFSGTARYHLSLKNVFTCLHRL